MGLTDFQLRETTVKPEASSISQFKMKSKHIQIIIGVAVAVYATVVSSEAQDFQNLDFESPLIDTGLQGYGGGLDQGYSGSGSVELFQLPDWTATIGSTEVYLTTT